MRAVLTGGTGFVGGTFWASSDMARRELGWQPRSLETGLGQLFGA